jgi:DNA polymerase elongation subunit (family B)
LLEDLIKLDITSSYPSVMKFGNLPYGWIDEEDKKENDFKFFRIYAKTDLINRFGLPFIKVENEFKARPYQSKIKKGTYLYLTSVEIENFKKYYKGKTIIDIVYSAKSLKGDFFFAEYIDFYFSLKENAKNAAEKIIAKLMLNSLYGKFGTKRMRQQRIYDNENFILITNETENEYYAPLATAIAAFGRMKLVDLIGYNYEIFIGGDTDSVIIPQKFLKYLKKFVGNNLGE